MSIAYPRSCARPDVQGGCRADSPTRTFVACSTPSIFDRFSPSGASRCAGDEMVMIGKDRPGFELPTILLHQLQQTPLKNNQSARASEMMRFEVSSCCNKIDSCLRKLMCWSVGPRWSLFRHSEIVTGWRNLGKREVMVCSTARAGSRSFGVRRASDALHEIKSGATAPHSKTLARSAEPRAESPQLWTAPRSGAVPAKAELSLRTPRRWRVLAAYCCFLHYCFVSSGVRPPTKSVQPISSCMRRNPASSARCGRHRCAASCGWHWSRSFPVA